MTDDNNNHPLVKLARTGLYDARSEHDGCGVGFIVNLQGTKSHTLVQNALEMLANLNHRGACGCESNTGDGAGLLVQIPHAFFHKECAKSKLRLPEPGTYGIGMLFLPRDSGMRAACEQVVVDVVSEEGQIFLGWRDVPVNNTSLGPSTREVEPTIRQIFIQAHTLDEDAFERRLYVIRKQIEKRVDQLNLAAGRFFYIPSLSCRTIDYKGMLLAQQVQAYYADIRSPLFASALAVVHSRFSTNTLPSWGLAHPFRYIAHNGEINTLRGNVNWMHTREAMFRSELFADVSKLFPTLTPGGSDSATLDNAVELLTQGGRSLPHAIMMLIPEAWGSHDRMDPIKKGFYEYHSTVMEPWDGPASVTFTDGRVVGAVLDRNGLRPSRYIVTKDDQVIMASEVGVVSVPEENIKLKGRLQPGKMFLIDLKAGCIVGDEEIKHKVATRRPYQQWVADNIISINDLAATHGHYPTNFSSLFVRQKIFGYTHEDMRILLAPTVAQGEEPVGSMGTDTPLAVLSERPKLLFNYFKQLFAQVTNPPIDSIREELVMSLAGYLGSEGNLLAETPEQCRMIRLEEPILTNCELEKLRFISHPHFKAATLGILFAKQDGEAGLAQAVVGLCAEADQAIAAGCNLLILSDRGVDENHVPMPSLLAVSGLHHHLIREGRRTKVGLILESGEPREMHHFALLIGYGVSAVNPYLLFETVEQMVQEKILPEGMTFEQAVANTKKAAKKALYKIFAKMGISTLQSYCGAQIFEAIGLNQEVINHYFTGTASRLGGLGLDIIAREAIMRHDQTYPQLQIGDAELDPGGEYQFRQRGEFHQWNPATIAKLQHAVRGESYATFKEFSTLANLESERLATIRSLLRFRFAWAQALPMAAVEPASAIVKRFATGAMSFGSISKEAHENLAIAMNRIGGKSNTGEGGEDEVRFAKLPNGDWPRSAIKQVASGRFGVTAYYLVNADELQIKIAQGAKPGEGGQLPGHKVDKIIARVRHSTPGVGLISPPPHHDIYSIEDLKQLIFDLKMVNPKARITVKLVAEVGVGTVAAGVTKAHADMILISGYDGGTGASPLTSIKHAGLPWELGIAETQQVLLANGLRGRTAIQVDGQLKTGRDVVMGALLGAEEFGFSTAPLIASGCIMMRKCHLNTCPVGIATQNPDLRKKFSGKPEHVINYFFYVAEEVREIMAALGIRKFTDLIGRTDLLAVREDVRAWKVPGLDLSALLVRVPPRAGDTVWCTQKQDHGVDEVLDRKLIKMSERALARKEPVAFALPIRNVNLAVGAMLAGEIARRHGGGGLPDNTIQIEFTGSAGQSFGAFLTRGVSFTLVGDANDYLGKGLSGGRIVVVPPPQATFVPEANILVGNTLLYGAISGEVYLRGVAGERFAVRNSGAHAVVEGVGDHGCEYMTGGFVVVLGPTGRNFAAGMSGGIAYVFDPDNDFEWHCNLGMVALERVVTETDVAHVNRLVRNHYRFTTSGLAHKILASWEEMLPHFVKVMPKDYKLALEKLAAESQREVVRG